MIYLLKYLCSILLIKKAGRRNHKKRKNCKIWVSLDHNIRHIKFSFSSSSTIHSVSRLSRAADQFFHVVNHSRKNFKCCFTNSIFQYFRVVEFSYIYISTI